MILYNDLIKKIPEFIDQDPFSEKDYTDIGLSPLGGIGNWLNVLIKEYTTNESLIQRICEFLNDIFTNAVRYSEDIKNNIQVYLFWTLEYDTIEKIKHLLDDNLLKIGREYLNKIDGENYNE